MGRLIKNNVVLVVEDEAILRMTAVDMLTDAGFEVLEAANATDALSILESRFDVHLVFSDIDMPNGMNGLKLAAMIRHRWPPIEIVLTSGHVAPDLASMPARCVFYPKPYRAEEVIGALERFAH